MAPIKLEKIMPKGSTVSKPNWLWAAIRAGDQKKTKRYMDPSKQQDVRAKVRTFRSAIAILSVGASEFRVINLTLKYELKIAQRTREGAN